jgi:hypothetical protein
MVPPPGARRDALQSLVTPHEAPYGGQAGVVVDVGEHQVVAVDEVVELEVVCGGSCLREGDQETTTVGRVR